MRDKTRIFVLFPLAGACATEATESEPAIENIEVTKQSVAPASYYDEDGGIDFEAASCVVDYPDSVCEDDPSDIRLDKCLDSDVLLELYTSTCGTGDKQPTCCESAGFVVKSCDDYCQDEGHLGGICQWKPAPSGCGGEAEGNAGYCDCFDETACSGGSGSGSC